MTTRICAQCETRYADTGDGRRLHQFMYGHPARPMLTLPSSAQLVICQGCRGGLHCDGDGGVSLAGESVPCGCSCPSLRKSGVA